MNEKRIAQIAYAAALALAGGVNIELTHDEVYLMLDEIERQAAEIVRLKGILSGAFGVFDSYDAEVYRRRVMDALDLKGGTP